MRFAERGVRKERKGKCRSRAFSLRLVFFAHLASQRLPARPPRHIPPQRHPPQPCTRKPRTGPGRACWRRRRRRTGGPRPKRRGPGRPRLPSKSRLRPSAGPRGPRPRSGRPRRWRRTQARRAGGGRRRRRAAGRPGRPGRPRWMCRARPGRRTRAGSPPSGRPGTGPPVPGTVFCRRQRTGHPRRAGPVGLGERRERERVEKKVKILCTRVEGYEGSRVERRGWSASPPSHSSPLLTLSPRNKHPPAGPPRYHTRSPTRGRRGRMEEGEGAWRAPTPTTAARPPHSQPSLRLTRRAGGRAGRRAARVPTHIARPVARLSTAGQGWGSMGPGSAWTEREKK